MKDLQMIFMEMDRVIQGLHLSPCAKSHDPPFRSKTEAPYNLKVEIDVNFLLIMLISCLVLLHKKHTGNIIKC